jgi:hypothetical protein
MNFNIFFSAKAGIHRHPALTIFPTLPQKCGTPAEVFSLQLFN